MFQSIVLNKRKTDSVRGLAILIMVLCHSTIQILDVNGINQHWLLQLNSLTSHIRMPLFMILTGYIVALQVSRGGFALKTRVRRLTIPFVVATVVILTVKYVATGRADLPAAIGYHLFVPYSHLWYLPSLLLILTVFAGAKQFAGNGGMAAAITVLAALLAGVAGLADQEWLAIGHALQLAPYFAAGYFARTLTAERDERALAPMALSLAALVFLNPSLNGLANFLMVTAAVFALALAAPANAALAFLGQRSMPIFLYHSLAISAVSRLVDIGMWGELIVAGISALAFPIAIYWAITRGLPRISILIGEACPSRQGNANRLGKSPEVASAQI